MNVETLDLDEEEQLASNVNLFSLLYCHQYKDCLLCVYQYLPGVKEQILRFESLLADASSKLGCEMNTCVDLVLRDLVHDESMNLFRQLSIDEICDHFDTVFGHPMCGYNRLKRYNFFSLFDETTVDNENYARFILNTYKYSRCTSLCPYALLCVYVYLIMINTVGGDITQFKKKHDYLWMYNCLSNHGIRKGKLK